MNLIKEISNPEQLSRMFSSEFSLENIELSAILLQDGPNIKIMFNKLQMPAHFPEKWKKNGFNALSFCLEFANLRNVRITEWNPAELCNPKIYKKNNLYFLSISKGENEYIYCESEFLYLTEVSGYIDERI